MAPKTPSALKPSPKPTRPFATEEHPVKKLCILLLLVAAPAQAQNVQRDNGYWQWVKSNCGYVWKWYPQAKAATVTSSATNSTTSTDNSVTHNTTVIYESKSAD